MRLNPFRKRRKKPPAFRPSREYKNPFFSKANFSDIFLKTLKIHYGGLILLVFALGYLTFFSSIFRLQTITVEGAEKISGEEIKEMALTELTQKRFYFFDNSNYFIFNQAQAAAAIKETIQKEVGLDYFILQKKFPRGLKIKLKEIIPSIVWFNGRDYYYLDREGIVAQSVKEEEINPEYPLIEDVNGFSVVPAEAVIAPEVIASLPLIKQKLTAIGLEILSFQTPLVKCPEILPLEEGTEEEEEESEIETNNNANQPLNINAGQPENTGIPQEECEEKNLLLKSKRIHAKTSQEYLLYFDVSQEIDRQINTLDLTLKTTLKGKTEDLEYIDLRFENRVYYR